MFIAKVLLCALWSGAKHSFLGKFTARSAWQAFAGISSPFSREEDRLNLFMAVPTVYAKLIAEFDQVNALTTM